MLSTFFVRSIKKYLPHAKLSNNYATKSVFVRQAGRRLSEQSVRAHFEKVAPVSSITLPVGRGAKKLFLFVEVDEKDFEKVLELDGSNINGSLITVNETRPLSEKQIH